MLLLLTDSSVTILSVLQGLMNLFQSCCVSVALASESHNAHILNCGQQCGTELRILFASHPYISVCQTCSQTFHELQSLAKGVSSASALSHLGRRMCHQFPWLPDSCVALGLALHERLIGGGSSPSKTKDRTLIIQVSYDNCVGATVMSVLLF